MSIDSDRDSCQHHHKKCPKCWHEFPHKCPKCHQECECDCHKCPKCDHWFDDECECPKCHHNFKQDWCW